MRGAAWRLALAAALEGGLAGLAGGVSQARSTFAWEPAATISDALRWGLVLPTALGAVSIVQLIIAGRTAYRRWKIKRVSERRHAEEHREWARRKQVHEQAQLEHVNAASEWIAATVRQTTRRLEVFGGNTWGWEALLTVYGMSVLATRPLIVLDFSRELVSAELARLAHSAGLIVRTQTMPAELATSDLASGMPPGKLTDVLIEAMYGDRQQAPRAERSLDHRIMARLCQALAPRVTIARLSAALAAMMGETPEIGVLSADEQDTICDEVFSEEYRTRNHAAITRMEAFLHPIKDLGLNPAPGGPAHFHLIALDDEGGPSAHAELLTDLILQYLTYYLAQAGHPSAPAVVIAGADDLARRHIERLSDVCERRQTPLMLLFRHLREHSLDLVGGGSVAFMRLGNHKEATAAADFIGRDHKFVLSQLTSTLGGNETHTKTTTESTSDSRSTGKATQYARNGLFSEGTSTQRSRTKTRDWSVAKAFAEGTNWSGAEAHQRVYEYIVEPTTLQHLPDHALLLAQTTPGRAATQLIPVECDPAIATLSNAVPQRGTPPHQIARGPARSPGTAPYPPPDGAHISHGRDQSPAT